MTIVEAVNLCLRGMQLAEVSALDEADIDATNALSAVNQKLGDLQSERWWFNTEPNWRLTANTLGHVAIPTNALSVVTTNSSRNEKDITIRGNRLYDTINHTFDIRPRMKNDHIEVTFIMKLTWDELPPIAQNYIAYAARRQFAQDTEVDTNRIQMLAREETVYEQRFLKENSRNKKTNYITDNVQNMTHLANIGGQNARSTTGRNILRRFNG